MGRPRKDLTPEAMIKLAQMYCSVENMAFWFDCSIDVVQNRCRDFFDMTFEEFSKHHRQQALAGVKQILWQKALKGDNTCIINLLKAYDPDFKNGTTTEESRVYVLNNLFMPDQVRRIATAALEEADYIEAECSKENGTNKGDVAAIEKPTDSVLNSDVEEIRAVPSSPSDS